MLRRSGILFVVLGCVLWATAAPVRIFAQDDPEETPLGDVARNMRRKPTTKPVIDDDNLPQVMQQAESRKGFGSSLRYLMAGEGNRFQIAVPDATCSLSFSANAKSLLSNQYAQMDLPAGEVDRLEGRATIEGDALTLPVRNDTGWHVSEVAVALTIVSKRDAFQGLSISGVGPGVAGLVAPESEVRPEKKPDITLIYRMRAAAAPFATTVFSAPLKVNLDPGDEWHWALVGAKGYPPESYSATKYPGAAPASLSGAVPTTESQRAAVPPSENSQQ